MSTHPTPVPPPSVESSHRRAEPDWMVCCLSDVLEKRTGFRSADRRPAEPSGRLAAGILPAQPQAQIGRCRLDKAWRIIEKCFH